MAAALNALLRHDGGWIQSDERAGHDTDRQVLVIGDNLGAVAAAGFLDHAGLEPVLAPPASESAAPPVTVIWEPGLALLERLGLCRPVVRHGDVLSTLDCLTTGQSWCAETDGRPALVAIDRPTLRRLLETHVLDAITTSESPVTATEATSNGVRVTFESGVTEPFDAAVTAERSHLATDDGDAGQNIHSWTFEWPDEGSAPDAPTEVWNGTAAAFTVPVAETTYVHLVETAEIPATAAVAPDDIASRFDHVFRSTGNPLPALDGDGFIYRHVSTLAPLSLSQGHITRIGPAARATLPGSHLGPTLDIEAAWTLADALAYGPLAVDEALDAYEHRRRRRMARLWIHGPADTEPNVATRLSSPLRQLWFARRIAFRHVHTSERSALAHDVPESL